MRISDWSSDVCSSDLSNKRMPSNPVIPAPSHAVAPATICLLRLSALGDATHVVPLVRTLRRAWPGVALTWVIGKGEYRLLEGDRKSGVEGTDVSGRVDFGGPRISKKKTTEPQ